MKLLRYGQPGQEKPGIIDKNQQIRSLISIVPDLTGVMLSPQNLAMLAEIDLEKLPLVDSTERIAPCVAQSGKFLCIGLNYKDHAKEVGIALSNEPVVFNKATSAICGANDHIIIPRSSNKTDWEVELGVVIGSTAKHVSEKNALQYVAGYCVVNDISEREFQLEGTSQWFKGKSCDTFGPIGPWLVTADEVPDPQNLEIWLEVNGHRYQESNTREMAFPIAYLVSYLSQFFTLHPGDIISTGTPHGVGHGQKPHPIYLKPGDVMRLGISGLGEQCQKTVADQ